MRATLPRTGAFLLLVLAACSGADVPAGASDGSGGAPGTGGDGAPSSGPGAGTTSTSIGAGGATASTGDPAGPVSSSAGPGGATASAATTGAGGSGGEGGAPTDCTGNWVGPPERVLELFDATPGSVAVSRGELEMHFVIYQGGALGAIMRSVRSSVGAPFPPPTFADDLDICDFDEDPYLDLSEDGLRAYVTCAQYDAQTGQDRCPDGGCAIRLAQRESPQSAFSVTGTVGFAGFHPSLRSDELEVVTNGAVLQVGVAPRMAQRNSIADAFGPATNVPIQVSGLAAVSGSTISLDGLELYAFARPEAGGETGLSRFTRSSTAEAFGARQPLALWGANTVATGAPDLMPDCRAMYVVRLADDGNGIDRITR